MRPFSTTLCWLMAVTLILVAAGAHRDLGAVDSDANPSPGVVLADSNDDDRWRDGADHWAFQPPVEPSLPQVNDASWPQSPIDFFVLSRLEAADLSPAEAADKRTLIRRATFDLIGLPPTPEEIARFVADNSPRAFAQVVDRLLAAPQYGERWGRHWLDVARYADSNGLDENVAQANAWRYRDYVIDSLSRDKPYDQFVREQLAGDLLLTDDPLAGNERIIATGFLVLGPKVLAEVDERKMEMDIVDEQIDAVGKALLGLTLGCARCHDHKFDPITMRDYYALAGIFKSTRTMESFTKIARWQEKPLYSEIYLREKGASERDLARKKRELAQEIARATASLRARLGQAAALPSKTEAHFSQQTRDHLKRLRDEIAALEKSAPQPPTAMCVSEGTVTNVPVHLRGSHLTLGERVPRGFPRAITRGGAPPIGAQSSGRLELANWLTQPNHPLTSRVMVNRIWRWHFGHGLVETTENFGRLGEPPVNAKLLDWLAVRFVKDNWSIKRMHRWIMMSATYQMSSLYNSRAATIDPRNRLLWRANIRRLTAEEIRDCLLSVSSQLDSARGGSLLGMENRKHIFDHTSKDETTYASRRRSVYLPVVRNHLYDAFTLFDYNDASVPNGNRTTVTVASQALYLMNSDFLVEISGHLADRLFSSNMEDNTRRIRALYTIVYGRPARDEDIERAQVFLQRFQSQLTTAIGNADYEVGARQRETWRLLCQSLLMSSEFIYLR